MLHIGYKKKTLSFAESVFFAWQYSRPLWPKNTDYTAAKRA